MTKLKINGKNRRVDVEDDTPLLWAIRDTVGLTGTSTAVASSNVEPARY